MKLFIAKLTSILFWAIMLVAGSVVFWFIVDVGTWQVKLAAGVLTVLAIIKVAK